ncbi:hypothetical protein PROFUN_14996 [Planoprotostelium fungivorum]|uniref:Uncharacterized protein n=1 Tax=Planoprotostelium fungivorum TaxID=1890364 RepID=A0A2P6MY26_9EUKA|nr:hypothetical protein PROFUN_14996 [Planoprotostelium fungivorum]
MIRFPVLVVDAVTTAEAHHTQQLSHSTAGPTTQAFDLVTFTINMDKLSFTKNELGLEPSTVTSIVSEKNRYDPYKQQDAQVKNSYLFVSKLWQVDIVDDNMRIYNYSILQETANRLLEKYQNQVITKSELKQKESELLRSEVSACLYHLVMTKQMQIMIPPHEGEVIIYFGEANGDQHIRAIEKYKKIATLTSYEQLLDTMRELYEENHQELSTGGYFSSGHERPESEPCSFKDVETRASESG